MPVKRRSTKRRSPKAMRRASAKRVKSTRARRVRRARATPKRKMAVVSPARRRQISKLISKLSPETRARLQALSKQYSSM